MPIYSIRVRLETGTDPSYLWRVDDIEAPNRDEAQKMARIRFAHMLGAKEKDIETYVMWNETRQQEDLDRYRECGLPDEIPS